MAARSNGRVYVGRLAGTPVFDPIGDRVGFVHDVLILFRLRRDPIAVGLVVEVAGRRRIFLPITRVTAIANGQVITTGLLNMRRFVQRAAETGVLAKVINSKATIKDTGEEVTVLDAAIEQVSGREWCLTTMYVQSRKGALQPQRSWELPFGEVSGIGAPHVRHETADILAQMGSMKAADVADTLRELPDEMQRAVVAALSDERLADVLEELDESEGANILIGLDVERAADVLDVMQPDDAADLVGGLPADQAARLLERMEPEEAEDVRRLLTYAVRTAGGLMTTEPVILPPDATVAQLLAAAARHDITPALAAVTFVSRPPLETPTGQFLGIVHVQRALREPPSTRLGTILDIDIEPVHPDDDISRITRRLANYNLTAIPVVDEGNLLGAVSVDDVLDHILPEDWRASDDEDEVELTLDEEGQNE